jgi:hypothetical protein
MRAATAYAQPSGAKPKAPRIAIVITGIGIGTSNTTATEAMNKLPAAVTLAFAPGGAWQARHAAWGMNCCCRCRWSGRGGGDRHQREAPAFDRLRPPRDSLDHHRPRRGEADGPR